MLSHTTIVSIFEQGPWTTSSSCRPTLRTIIRCLIVFRARWKLRLLPQILLIINLGVIGVVNHRFIMSFRPAATILLGHRLDPMTRPWWSSGRLSVHIIHNFSGHCLKEWPKFAQSIVSLLENSGHLFLLWFRIHIISITADSVSSRPLYFWIQFIIKVRVLYLFPRVRYSFRCKFRYSHLSLSLNLSISLSFLFIFSFVIKCFLLSVPLWVGFLVVILIF